MSDAAEKLLQAALSLPESERRRLGESILGSIAASVSPEPEWQDEVARRLEAIASGEARLVPGAEVSRRALEAIRNAR